MKQQVTQNFNDPYRRFKYKSPTNLNEIVKCREWAVDSNTMNKAINKTCSILGLLPIFFLIQYSAVSWCCSSWGGVNYTKTDAPRRSNWIKWLAVNYIALMWIDIIMTLDRAVVDIQYTTSLAHFKSQHLSLLLYVAKWIAIANWNWICGPLTNGSICRRIYSACSTWHNQFCTYLFLHE